MTQPSSLPNLLRGAHEEQVLRQAREAMMNRRQKLAQDAKRHETIEEEEDLT